MKPLNKKILMGAAFAGIMMATTMTYADDTHKATTTTPDANAVGECHGVNSCKGTGACGGKDSSCAGKNSCKGQGWLKMSKADCDAKKGTFVAEKSHT